LNTAVNARVKTSDFNTFKTSNTAAIADAKKAGTDAAAAANVADGKAEGAQKTADNALSIANAALPMNGTGTMTGALNMGSKKITNLATPSNEADAATKKYVDEAKSAVLGSTNDSATVKTVYGAHAAAAAAQSTANQGVSDAAAAQSTADSALTLAGQKTTMAEVEAKDYATKSQAQGYVNTLKGKSSDSTTAITVHGAINKAAAAQTSANTGITNAAAAQATADSAVTAAAEAHAAANVADGKAVAAHNAANAANDNANTRVLTTDFNTFKTSNSETLNALDGRITTAQTTADKGVSDAATAQARADKGVADAATALAQANKMLPKTGGTMSGAINMGSKKITNLAAPTNNTDAATKKYVDDAKAAAIAEADAAQSTADSALSIASAALPKAGGTMTGAINMGGKQITNMATPTNDAHATTKKYVDDAIAAGIKANDAMTFKGTVGGSGATVSTLPTTAQKGDTYKVAAKGKYANVEAKVGDLFINVANDDATASWTHISSGYEDDYLQKLAVNQNTIHLTDGVTNSSTGSVSGFKIVGKTDGNGAAVSNLVFEVTAGSGDKPIHTISAHLEWGTF
jgi:hypothetical protein